MVFNNLDGEDTATTPATEAPTPEETTEATPAATEEVSA